MPAPSQFLATASLADLPTLQWLDWAVIAFYTAFVFGIAFWALPKIKDCGSFLVGSRKMGKIMTTAAGFAGGTNANHPIAVAAATYQSGMAGLWINITYLLLTPFLWMYPPLIRRLRIVTLADAMRMRFGPGMAMIFKVVTLVTMPVAMGLGIKSAAIVIQVMSGGTISPEFAVALIAIPTLIYTLIGGVIAAYATDVYQSLLIVLLSFILLPFAIVKAGGMAALDAGIDDQLTDIFGGVGADFGPWWIFWFAIGITFAAATGAVGGAMSAKSEMASRAGVYGSVIKRFCTVGWGLVGLFAIALFAGHPLLTPGASPGATADNVFPLASSMLLPVGLRGVMVASILAAVMSSLATGMLVFGGMMVNNVYQEHWRKNAPSAHYLLMARVFAGVGLLGGWWIATGITDIVEFATIVEPIGSLTGIAFMVALVWRGVTARGAMLSVIVAAPLFIASNTPNWPDWAWVRELVGHPVSLFDLLQLRPVVDWMAGLYGLDLHALGCFNVDGSLVKLPVQIKYPLYIVPSLGGLIVLSLLTRQHNERSVAEFYCRLDTPVGEEAKIRETGFQVDQLENLDHHDLKIDARDHAVGERLLLADLLYLPSRIRAGTFRFAHYKWDWIGCAAGLAFIVLFLLGVQWLGSFL